MGQAESTTDDEVTLRLDRRQRLEAQALEASRENLWHATEATRVYLEAQPDSARRRELPSQQDHDDHVGGRVDVIVEGDVLTFQASTQRLHGETVEQHRARSVEQARALGRAAQPDNTPHVDEVGDDRRARARSSSALGRGY